MMMFNYSYMLSEVKNEKACAVFQVEFIYFICFGIFLFFNLYKLLPNHELLLISKNLLFAKSRWFLNTLLLLDSFEHFLLKLLLPWLPGQYFLVLSSFLSGHLSLTPS